VGAALSRAALFARTEPLNSGSRDEVEHLLGLGVEVLMLPMFETADEVERFASLVGGRAHLVLLLETVGGLRELDAIVALDGVDEVHVGINDMALAMGLPNRFAVALCSEVEEAAATCRDAGVPFGIGGLGRVGDRSLPIDPDLLYAQYARLGATSALLSRAFLVSERGEVDLARELAASRERLAHWFSQPPAEVERAATELRRAVGDCASW
jgi:2-keto-3-deoxy-L-rhamnonate aldolase RhmA